MNPTSSILRITVNTSFAVANSLSLFEVAGLALTVSEQRKYNPVKRHIPAGCS